MWGQVFELFMTLKCRFFYWLVSLSMLMRNFLYVLWCEARMEEKFRFIKMSQLCASSIDCQEVHLCMHQMNEICLRINPHFNFRQFLKEWWNDTLFNDKDSKRYVTYIQNVENSFFLYKIPFKWYVIVYLYHQLYAIV